MMKLELPELVRLSDHIAVVDVTSVRSAWDEKHERIYSTIVLNVVDTWKAPVAADGTTARPAALTIVQPGGTVGDMSMVVMGMGTFVPGARSLVFLRGSATHAQVVGMTQGVHALRFEPTAKRWTVGPSALSQVKLVRPVTLPAPGAGPLKVAPPSGTGAKIAPPPSQSSSSSPPSSSLPSSSLPSSSSPSSSPSSPVIDLAERVPLDTMKAEVLRLIDRVP